MKPRLTLIVALLTYLIWLPAIFGLGTGIVLLVRRLRWLQPPEPDTVDLLYALIAGFAVIGLTANIVNFLTAVSPIISALLWVAGWLLLLINRAFVLQAARPAPAYGWWAVLIVIAAVLLILATSVQPDMPPSDSALYHIQTIRWLSYGILATGLA